MRLRQLEMVARTVKPQVAQDFARHGKTRRRIVIGAMSLGLVTLLALTQRLSPRSLETDVSGSLETSTPEMLGSSAPEPIDVSRVRVCRCPKKDPDHQADALKEVGKNVPILRNCMSENPDAAKKNCFLKLMGCVQTVWKNFSGSTCIDRAAAYGSSLINSPFFLSEIIRGAPCSGNLTEGEAFEIVSDAVQTYPCLTASR